MIRKIILLIFIVAASVSAVDHFYAAGLAAGGSTALGSDVPAHSEPGLVISASVLGAQAFYPAGPLWGTELSFTSQALQRDTTLWNDAKGSTYMAKNTQRLGSLSLGIFVMKSWDFGLSVAMGPQVSYLASCSNNVGSSSNNCQDSYQMFHYDGQVTLTYALNDVVAFNLKFVQTALPMDTDQNQKIFPSVLTLGALYLF